MQRSKAMLVFAGVIAFALVAGAGRAATPAQKEIVPRPAPLGPGPVPVDFFHPDNQPGPDGARPTAPVPAYGGRAIVHLEALPKSLNYALEGTGYTRRILFEINENLILEDWETLEWKPNLAKSWQVEDQVVLPGGDVATGKGVLVGLVEDLGDRWRLSSGFPEAFPFPRPNTTDLREMQRGHAVQVRELRKEEVQAVERGTVITFNLRDDVRWHDGHRFDAYDARFSWAIYQNPKVECGEKRAQFKKIVRAEVLDLYRIRFTFEKQYFNALRWVGDMAIVPSHLYDLDDPDNPRYDADYHARRKAADPAWKPDDAERATYINQNPHNRAWIGLGPYKLTSWDGEALEATRFDDYFDTSRAGYLDVIRWRYIKDDRTAFQALLNGELDYTNRVSGDDFFGDTVKKPLFTEKFYKGAFDSAAYWYVAWNLQSPKLADVRVRHALARVFDFDAFKQSCYKGYAEQVTGHFPLHSRGYNHDVRPFPYEPGRAAEMLAEAGWYDRDGDGVLDKDGVALTIEFLAQSGNQVVDQFAPKFQEDLARIGVQLDIRTLELAAVIERGKSRDFESLSLAWVLPPESDPEQAWHSKNAAVRSVNYAGLGDAQVDALIERGQRELDPEKRAAIWRELHVRLYELQPYLWGYSPMRKFFMSRKLRGLQCVPLDPNYVIRRWYYPRGTPGTRATRVEASQKEASGPR